MKKSKFTESQIISILKEVGAGVMVKDICRKHGISSPTYYSRKSKYDVTEASELTRVEEMETENAKLKKMYTVLALENAAMKELISKSFNTGREASCRRLPGQQSEAVRGSILFGLPTLRGSLRLPV